MKKKKNRFLPFITALFFWIILGYIVFYVPPLTIKEIFVFYVFLLISSFFAFSFVFSCARHGFVLTLAFVLTLFFRQIEMLNVINLILICSLSLAIEIYSKKNKSNS